MAVLSATDRDRVKRYFMRQGDLLGTVAFNKAELAAAVDATDDWIEANTASYNAALPAAFRTKASLLQKTLLFCWVALRRAGLAKVQEDS